METTTQRPQGPPRCAPVQTSTLGALLSDETDGFHVSIYQRTEPITDAREALKRHLKRALRHLQDEGMPQAEGQALLRDAGRFVRKGDRFWNRSAAGLALFINAKGTFIVPAARQFANQVVVSCEFHLKPLLALAANVGAYHLLNLDPLGVALWRGSDLGFRDEEVDGLPRNWETAMARLGYASDALGDPSSTRELDRDILNAFFREIDTALCRHLTTSEWPLLLAGEPRYEGFYREVNHFPHLSDAYLQADPNAMRKLDLHRQASTLLQTDFIESQRRTLSHLTRLEPTQNVQTSLPEVLESARAGRVKTLAVPEDSCQWGTFDPDEARVHRSGRPGLASADLYESAARSTLEHDGEVYFIPTRQMPHGADILAKLRW